MEWLIGPRRGPQWKQGWKERTLANLSVPPAPLIAVLAIVFLFLSLSSYVDTKAQVRRAEAGFRLLLLLLPVALIFAARYAVIDFGRFTAFRIPRQNPPPPEFDTDRPGSSPWGVAAVVAVLLVMVALFVFDKWQNLEVSVFEHFEEGCGRFKNSTFME